MRAHAGERVYGTKNFVRAQVAPSRSYTNTLDMVRRYDALASTGTHDVVEAAVSRRATPPRCCSRLPRRRRTPRQARPNFAVVQKVRVQRHEPLNVHTMSAGSTSRRPDPTVVAATRLAPGGYSAVDGQRDAGDEADALGLSRSATTLATSLGALPTAVAGLTSTQRLVTHGSAF